MHGFADKGTSVTDKKYFMVSNAEIVECIKATQTSFIRPTHLNLDIHLLGRVSNLALQQCKNNPFAVVLNCEADICMLSLLCCS